MKKPHFLKITAVLTAIFIASDPGYGYASTPRLDPSAALKIPADLGREEESFRGLSSKTILYIQDAHDSFEAQKNIASLVTHLTEKSGIKTVFEEGYQGPVPTDKFFGFIQDGEARLKVSSFLLDKLRIGGAEYAHINRKTDFSLIGADHLDHYRQNIQAFRDAAEKNADIEKDLTAILTEIESLAHQKFPKPLREWLDTRDRYEAGQLDLLEYVERGWKILEAQPEGSAAKKSFPVISIMLAAKNTPDEAIAAKARAIEPHELFREITALDKAIAALFTREEKETLLLHYRSALHLLKRLNQIEVSPAEYAASKEILSGLNTRELADFIAREAKKSLVLSKAWEENIKTASRFYELAHQRDDAVEQTLKSYLSSTDENAAVLVYGGFHKAGILSILRRLGVSYRVITPHISGTDPVHENYYKQLMAEGVHDYEKSLLVPAGLAPKATRPPSAFVEPFGETAVQAVYTAVAENPGTSIGLLDQKLRARQEPQGSQKMPFAASPDLTSASVNMTRAELRLSDNADDAGLLEDYPQLKQISNAWEEFLASSEADRNRFLNAYEGGAFVRSPFQWMNFMKENWNLNAQSRILDVGSGNGLAAIAFNILTGAKVTSIEVDPMRWVVLQSFLRFLKEQKNLEFPDVRFEQADFLNYPLENFDFIYFYYTHSVKNTALQGDWIVNRLSEKLPENAVFVSPGFYLFSEYSRMLIMKKDRNSYFAETPLDYSEIILPKGKSLVHTREAAVLKRRHESTSPQEDARSELRASYSKEPAAPGLNLAGSLLAPDLFVASSPFTKLLTFKEFFFSTAPQGTRRGLIDELITGRKTFSPQIQNHFRGPSPANRAFFISGSPTNPASEYSEYEIYKTLAGLLLNMLEEPERQIFSDFYKQNFSSDRQFVKVIRGMGDFRGIVVSESYVNSPSLPAIIRHEQFHMALDDFLKAATKNSALRKDFEDVRELLPVFVRAGGLESLLASLGKLSSYAGPIEALKKGNFSFTEEFLAQTLYTADAPPGLESAFAALKNTLARIEAENSDFRAGMRVLRRLQPSSDAKAAEKNALLNDFTKQIKPGNQTSPEPEPSAEEGLASFSSESLRDLYVKAPQDFISSLTRRLQQHFTRAGMAGGALSVGNLIIIQITEGASIRSASLEITAPVEFDQLSQKTREFLTSRSELRAPELPAELEGFNSSTPIWDFLTAFGIDPAHAKVEPLKGPWGRVSAAKNAVFGMQPGPALNEAVMESALDIFNADSLISDDLPKDLQSLNGQIDSLYLLTYQNKPAAIVWNLEEAKSKPILFYPFVGKNQGAYWTDKDNSGEDRQPPSAIYTRLMDFLDGFYQRSGTLDGAVTGKSFDILRADTDGMTLLRTFQDKVIFPTVFDPGAHPSTASLIEHLNRLEDRGIFEFNGKTVSEIGAGSGWIGSQAALLGASSVHVYDLSLLKAANANATAKRLGTQDRVTALRSKSADILPPSNLYIWNAPDFSDSAIRDDDSFKTAGVSASINNEINPADVQKVFSEIRQSAPADALLLVRILHNEFEGLQKIAQASGWNIHPLNYDLARGVLAGGRFVLLRPAPLSSRSELRSQEASGKLLGFDRSTPLWDFLSAFGIDSSQAEVETLEGPWGRVPAAQHEAFGVAAGSDLREAVLESAYAVFDSREIRERLNEQSIPEDKAIDFLYLLTFENIPVSLVWAIPGEPFQPLFYYPLAGRELDPLWKGSSPEARTSVSSPPLPQDLELFIRAHHKKDFGKNPVLQGGLPLNMQRYGLPGGALREFEEGVAFPTVFSLNHQTSKGLVETAGQLIAAGIFSIEGETVSEVGTGAGWIAAQMALRGAAEVHAYDLNLMKAANAAQTARRHGVAGRFHAYRARSANILPSSRLYLWNIPDFADSAAGVLDRQILDQSESIAVNNRIPVESVRRVFQELSAKARPDSLFLVRTHPWDEPAFFEMLKNSGWEIHPSFEKEIQNPGRGGSFFLLRPELEKEAAARRAGEEALSRDFRGTPESLEALRAVAQDLQPDQHGFPVLLIEGLPGSGKSSRAKDLKAVLESQGRKAVIIHSEHYLLQGRYNKPIRAFFGLLTRWIARQPNENLFDYAARAFVDTARVERWISDINALRAEGGLLTIDRDQKIQEKLTPDTVLIIEGTLSSHLFRKLSGAKRLFLDVPAKTIRHQFVKRTLFEAAGGVAYGSFKARLMAPGIAVGFFRRHAARFDFILKTQSSGAVSLIRPRIASAAGLPAEASKDPSRSELRNTQLLDLTPEEKNLILESARSGFHRQGAVDETTPIWFFGEQEVVEPFIAPFFSQTSDKALPSELFQNKKVLVMPGYGNLPFVLRAFGAREVVAADRDPVTIAWQKLKWKSGVENINDWLFVSESSRFLIQSAVRQQWLRSLNAPVDPKNTFDGMTFQTADILQPLPLTGEKYDLIVVPYLFGFAHGLVTEDQWDKALENLGKVLAPGGRVILAPGKLDLSKLKESDEKTQTENYQIWLNDLKRKGWDVSHSKRYSFHHILGFEPVSAGLSILTPRSELRAAAFISPEELDSFFQKVRAVFTQLPADFKHRNELGYEFKTREEVTEHLGGPDDNISAAVSEIYQQRGFMMGSESTEHPVSGKPVHTRTFWIDPSNPNFRFGALLEIIKRGTEVVADVYDQRDTEAARDLIRQKLGAPRKPVPQTMGLAALSSWRALLDETAVMDLRLSSRSELRTSSSQSFGSVNTSSRSELRSDEASSQSPAAEKSSEDSFSRSEAEYSRLIQAIEKMPDSIPTVAEIREFKSSLENEDPELNTMLRKAMYFYLTAIAEHNGGAYKDKSPRSLYENDKRSWYDLLNNAMQTVSVGLLLTEQLISTAPEKESYQIFFKSFLKSAQTMLAMGYMKTQFETNRRAGEIEKLFEEQKPKRGATLDPLDKEVPTTFGGPYTLRRIVQHLEVKQGAWFFGPLLFEELSDEDKKTVAAALTAETRERLAFFQFIDSAWDEVKPASGQDAGVENLRNRTHFKKLRAELSDIFSFGIRYDAYGVEGVHDFIQIAFEGKVRSSFRGSLTAHPQFASDSAGEHGSFYVIFKHNIEDPFADQRDHHRWYLVPEQSDKDAISAMAEKAVGKGLLAPEVSADIQSKLVTYQEFINLNRSELRNLKDSEGSQETSTVKKTVPIPADELKVMRASLRHYLRRQIEDRTIDPKKYEFVSDILPYRILAAKDSRGKILGFAFGKKGNRHMHAIVTEKDHEPDGFIYEKDDHGIRIITYVTEGDKNYKEDVFVLGRFGDVYRLRIEESGGHPSQQSIEYHNWMPSYMLTRAQEVEALSRVLGPQLYEGVQSFIPENTRLVLAPGMEPEARMTYWPSVQGSVRSREEVFGGLDHEGFDVAHIRHPDSTQEQLAEGTAIRSLVNEPGRVQWTFEDNVQSTAIVLSGITLPVGSKRMVVPKNPDDMGRVTIGAGGAIQFPEGVEYDVIDTPGEKYRVAFVYTHLALADWVKPGAEIAAGDERTLGTIEKHRRYPYSPVVPHLHFAVMLFKESEIEKYPQLNYEILNRKLGPDQTVLYVNPLSLLTQEQRARLFVEGPEAASGFGSAAIQALNKDSLKSVRARVSHALLGIPVWTAAAPGELTESMLESDAVIRQTSAGWQVRLNSRLSADLPDDADKLLQDEKALILHLKTLDLKLRQIREAKSRSELRNFDAEDTLTDSASEIGLSSVWEQAWTVFGKRAFSYENFTDKISFLSKAVFQSRVQDLQKLGLASVERKQNVSGRPLRVRLTNIHENGPQGTERQRQRELAFLIGQLSRPGDEEILRPQIQRVLSGESLFALPLETDSYEDQEIAMAGQRYDFPGLVIVFRTLSKLFGREYVKAVTLAEMLGKMSDRGRSIRALAEDLEALGIVETLRKGSTGSVWIRLSPKLDDSQLGKIEKALLEASRVKGDPSLSFKIRNILERKSAAADMNQSAVIKPSAKASGLFKLTLPAVVRAIEEEEIEQRRQGESEPSVRLNQTAARLGVSITSFHHSLLAEHTDLRRLGIQGLALGLPVDETKKPEPGKKKPLDEARARPAFETVIREAVSRLRGSDADFAAIPIRTSVLARELGLSDTGLREPLKELGLLPLLDELGVFSFKPASPALEEQAGKFLRSLGLDPSEPLAALVLGKSGAKRKVDALSPDVKRVQEILDRWQNEQELRRVQRRKAYVESLQAKAVQHYEAAVSSQSGIEESKKILQVMNPGHPVFSTIEPSPGKTGQPQTEYLVPDENRAAFETNFKIFQTAFLDELTHLKMRTRINFKLLLDASAASDRNLAAEEMSHQRWTSFGSFSLEDIFRAGKKTSAFAAFWKAWDAAEGYPPLAEEMTKRLDVLRRFYQHRSELRITDEETLKTELRKNTSLLHWQLTLSSYLPEKGNDRVDITLQIARGIRVRLSAARSLFSDPEFEDAVHRYIAAWIYNLSIVYGTSFAAAGAEEDPSLVDPEKIETLLTKGDLSSIRESLSKGAENPLGIASYANAGRPVRIKRLTELTDEDKQIQPVALQVKLQTQVPGTYLGIDIGGGSAKWAVLQDGKLLDLPKELKSSTTLLMDSASNPVFESPEDYVVRLTNRARDILDYLKKTYGIEKIDGVGIDIPGAADFNNNTMVTLGQIPVKKEWNQEQVTWTGREIPRQMAEALGLEPLRVRIRNDMDGVLPGVASVLPAAKKDFWERTGGHFGFDWMGTGHGNQYAVAGVPMNAPTESGHMTFDFGQPGQPLFDTEAYTSIPSMLIYARELVRQSGNGWPEISGDQLKPLADQAFYEGKDPVQLKRKSIAMKVFERFAEKYAANLALRYVLAESSGFGNASEILLGGGIARGRTGSLLRDLTLKHLRSYGLDNRIQITVIQDDDIRQAGLDPDDVGPAGSAYFIQSLLAPVSPDGEEFEIDPGYLETPASVPNDEAFQSLARSFEDRRLSWIDPAEKAQGARTRHAIAAVSFKKYVQWKTGAQAAPLLSDYHFTAGPSEEEIRAFPDLKKLVPNDPDLPGRRPLFGSVSGSFFTNEAGQRVFLVSIIQTGVNWKLLERTTKNRYDPIRGASLRPEGNLYSWYGTLIAALEETLRAEDVHQIAVLSSEGIREIRTISGVKIGDEIADKMYGKPGLGYETARVKLRDASGGEHELAVWKKELSGETSQRSELRESGSVSNKGTLMISASSLSSLTQKGKDELFSRLYLNRASLRLIIFRDGPALSGQALNALLKLPNVFVTAEKDYAAAARKQAIPGASVILLLGEEESLSPGEKRIKGVLLKDQAGEIEFARLLAFNGGTLPNVPEENGVFNPPADFLSDLNQRILSALVVAYSA